MGSLDKDILANQSIVSGWFCYQNDANRGVTIVLFSAFLTTKVIVQSLL